MPKTLAEDTTSLTSGDFVEIEKAVMATERGRWFLNEYAKRLRQADTNSMVAAMAKLEAAFAANQDEIMHRLARALNATHETMTDAANRPAPEINARHMKYFRDDEDLFAPVEPSAGTPVLAAVPSSVQHLDPFDATEPPARAQAAPTPIDGLGPPPATQPPAKSRIVIIRHKPGDEIDVPLQQEFAVSG